MQKNNNWTYIDEVKKATKKRTNFILEPKFEGVN